ncbi:acetoacetate decarboxylase [Haloferax mediterranei ATCC 33500]|uniref:Acetoacetate decarboxylase n=1 Tax=Haloferax mediterranei (strain ATCC 33500 / DSM 1411 / JCM 8866 / NBRC 14739 / NCIMB 2177 / R-4) TaxID=523841 RepID=I3R604_HALMT|nr:hypothetical protein [Haloferax mediterranei]AFK19664.1 hypothetical protein HFX_1971 [Haloferax mediterranei ATCC 33500]AHZ23053.1 acetoacetate decarboxylase [Haloferax mediterranei ATCC 33500]ELZ99984.1 hypothetical protein C439_11633 [Haloferax mediterranei ATCC 33500]MDX5987594.1 acetoacetate decarboxylase [Haloferax mediterranei ATCC 33500]QCQ74082.1 acetoacetate decarboxylase [Haloferax mediterranei ATCC 33500]
MTDIELKNEGGQIVAYDKDTGNKVAVPVEELTTESAYVGGVTMYVRSTGDDANDGLSADNPKQTINAAIADAPIHGDRTTRLTIDIGSDTISDTATDLVELREASVPFLHIVGATDGSGNPAGVLDASGNKYGVDAWGPMLVTLENVVLKNADNRNLLLRNLVYCKTINCDVIDGGFRNAGVGQNSVLRIDAASKWDITGTTGADNNIELINSMLECEGEIVGTGGGNSVIKAKQESVVLAFSNSLYDANGDNEPCIVVTDSSDLKIGKNTTFQNAYAIARGRRGCTIKTVDYSTVAQNSLTHDIDAPGLSIITDETTSETVTTLPKMSSDPTTFIKAGPANGRLYYNLSTEFPRFYSDTRSEWEELVGGQVVNEGTVTVSAGSSTVVTVDTGPTEPVLPVWSFATEPAAAVDVRHEMRYGGGETRVAFIEQTANASVELTFKIYKVPRSA